MPASAHHQDRGAQLGIGVAPGALPIFAKIVLPVPAGAP